MCSLVEKRYATEDKFENLEAPAISTLLSLFYAYGSRCEPSASGSYFDAFSTPFMNFNPLEP